MNIGWLTLTLLLPLVGAVAVMAVPKARATLAKQVALGFAVLTLALTIVIAVGYHRNGAADYTVQHNWIEAFGAHYALGLDGIGLVLGAEAVVRVGQAVRRVRRRGGALACAWCGGDS